MGTNIGELLERKFRQGRWSLSLVSRDKGNRTVDKWEDLKSILLQRGQSFGQIL